MFSDKSIAQKILLKGGRTVINLNLSKFFPLILVINRQSLVKSLYHFKQITFILIKVPHRNVGNFKRAKVPSFHKGKLGLC